MERQKRGGKRSSQAQKFEARISDAQANWKQYKSDKGVLFQLIHILSQLVSAKYPSQFIMVLQEETLSFLTATLNSMKFYIKSST